MLVDFFFLHLTPAVQGGAEGSVRLLLTKNTVSDTR